MKTVKKIEWHELYRELGGAATHVLELPNGLLFKHAEWGDGISTSLAFVPMSRDEMIRFWKEHVS